MNDDQADFLQQLEALARDHSDRAEHVERKRRIERAVSDAVYEVHRNAAADIRQQAKMMKRKWSDDE